ncbi:hypothetical protein LMG28727_04804 [Paraburkholderia kirstenboschensis]|nr:hypothetical protein LMG28727_04804 [Paraburkholderia kirstenboschensis]
MDGGLIEAKVGMSQESRSNVSRGATRRGVAVRIGALGVSFALCAALTGCGLAAAPCRIASAGLKIVPVVGHVAAAPTDACAEVIDP